MSIRFYGVRGSLIGDSVCALPVYACVRKVWPDAHTIWQVARKCSQAAPLFYNNPLITELTISDCKEGMGPRDLALAATCHHVFDVTPQHPDGDVWPNLRGMVHETFRMSGLTDDDWKSLTVEEQRPHLTKWFETERRPKTVALWPSARQGEKQKRVASRGWYEGLVARLVKEGYTVLHFGHPNDGEVLPLTRDCRHGAFMELIQASLGCDVIVGTDSGSLLALAAYEERPSISLITNHIPGHTLNPFALAPNNALNNVLFAAGDPDLISHDDVVAAVKDMI